MKEDGLTAEGSDGIISVLDDGPEALPPITKEAGGGSMTNVELLAVLIAIASLALTIYFGKR